MKDKTKKKSKFLSLILRHKPEIVGVTLDSGGWINIQELLKAFKSHGKNDWSIDILHSVVENNDKQRFAISEDGKRIRANQGHSVNVKLGYKESAPPAYLFHGTSKRFLDSIYKYGIQKMKRHHVHLSDSTLTAEKVGKRKGTDLIVLKVDSHEMNNDGYAFYLSDNGVWLTDHIPPGYFIALY